MGGKVIGVLRGGEEIAARNLQEPLAERVGRHNAEKLAALGRRARPLRRVHGRGAVRRRVRSHNIHRVDRHNAHNAKDKVDERHKRLS